MNLSSPWRLTRRAVLTGAAGAGAIAVLEPIAGLAQTLAGDGPTFSRMVGSLAGTSPVLVAPRRFSLVGVEWSRPLSAQIELRALGADGHWSQWVAASTRGHDPDIVRERASLFGEPIWTGPARSVQLRAAKPVSAVKLHFVDEQTPGGAVAAATTALAAPILDAGAGQPPIIARSAWAQGHARPAVPASYGNVRLGFVHHTESPNGYRRTDVPAILRSIFVFHRFVRGYHDIAYNFMIDAFGRIWEARAGGIDLPVIGAQAGGYNGVSTGVAVIGSFMNVVPAPSAIAALERLLAWKLSLHGLPTRGHVTVEVSPAAAFYTRFAPGAHVSLPRIAGHRDGDSTDCPGDALYARLPAIRLRTAALATAPARVTLLGPSTAVLAGETVVLSGRLAMLSAQPIAGAPIELQQIASGTEDTVDTVLTGADGSWSVPVALSVSTALRALHRPAPASVSDLVFVSVAPRVTLAVVSPAPLRVAGEVTPAKRRVTVDAYQLRGAHRRLVASKRVASRAGQFTATLTIRRPGPYLLIARTSADINNAEGTSPSVQVTV
jgi:N-acetylmuramoyl-L-alanine amidase